MVTTARKIRGLRAHTFTSGVTPWSSGQFYDQGVEVERYGHTFRSRAATARGHGPEGLPIGVDDDLHRQMVLDACNLGWGAGTTGGGLTAPLFIVTNASASAIAGSYRDAINQAILAGSGWIRFDPDAFPIDNPTVIANTTNPQIGPNTTIDGYGAGVTFAKYPTEFRSDPGSPVVTNRGLATANILIAYVNFLDFPNGTSVLEFGGNNPFQRGGADLVYLHHITIADTADQQHSNGQHDNMVSRSTLAWSRCGPAPDPLMMSHVIGGGLKLFRVDASDVTNDTITALNPAGDPTNHELIFVTTLDDDGNLVVGARGAWTWNGFSRDDLTAHPFPTGTAFLAGHTYSVRHWGPGTGKTFTADSTTGTITCTAHGFSEGDPVVLYDTTKGTSLPGAATAGGSSLRNGYIYFVKYINANSFKLSVKSGGGAKDFSDNGSGTLTVKKADLTKFQITDGNQTGWDPINFTTTGTGWWIEETEPLYYENGKGPQWGSHHADDVPDAFMSFRVGAANTIETLYDHLLENGDRVRFWTQGANLPTSIVQGDTYYVRDKTATTFKLATTAGGTAITFGATAGDEQTFTITDATDTINAVGHGLANGNMVTFYGTSLPTGIKQGVTYWVRDKTTDTFRVAKRKGDPFQPLSGGSGTMTMVKKNPLVQLIIGPNRATYVFSDFDRMKIRSPKIQCSWAHEYNCRVHKWGDPDRGDTTGGFGTEMGDQAQVLVEGCLFEPYVLGESHYWSRYTNPPENVPTRGPSINAINLDAATAGPVRPSDWTGGSAVIHRNNNFLNGATTRDATSGATVIVNSARLDWYDPANGLEVPYDYELIDVTDPFILDTILDRGAGNVQPWELVS